MDSDSIEVDEFVPREYQTQLFDVAKRKNVILFLPTGSGKTYISVLLLKHFGASIDMNLDFETERKWSYFLVNTTTLVHQQAQVIRNSSSFVVCELTGDLGVENWTYNKWQRILKNHQVLVLTSQIYLDAVRLRIFSIEKSSVLIFDECHHATKDHPMSLIMDEYRKVTGYDTQNQIKASKIPRVVGLTGTLLNAGIKQASKIQKIWKTLEYKMCSTIVTIPDRAHIKSYSTNPQEIDVLYKFPNAFPEGVETYMTTCTELMANMNSTSETNAPNGEEFGKLRLLNNPLKILKQKWTNFVADLTEIIKCMGCYGFYHCSTEWYIKVENMRMRVGEGFPDVFECLNTALAQLRVITKWELEKYGDINNSEEMWKSFPDKMVKILEQLKTADDKTNSKTIVFVERKITAVALYQFLKKFLECHEPMRSMKVEYLIGRTGYVGNLSKEAMLMRRKTEAVLDKFNKGEVNILVSTNLLEEGMDISTCNKIIMFDFPKTWCSYVQSKGRARSSTSKCIYLIPDSKEGLSMQQKKENYKEIELEVDRLCRSNFNENFEFIYSLDDGFDFPDDDESKENVLEEYYANGPDSAKVTLQSAISILNCYCQTKIHDRYCHLAPEYRIKVIKQNGNERYKCMLWFSSHKCRDIFMGDEYPSMKLAKKSVALKAVKKLHQLKELDDHFHHIKKKVSEADMMNWCPHKKVHNEASVGTKRHKAQYDVFCSPLLEVQFSVNVESCYLHVFTLTLAVGEDLLLERKNLLRSMILRSNVTYGIITSKKLPNLSSFPVYTNVGKMNVKILHNAKKIGLNGSQFEILKKFHAFLFLDVLRVVKKCLVMNSNGSQSQNSYLVVPVKRQNDQFDIDWEIAAINKNNDVVAPSLKEKTDARYTNEKYFERVVTPYYRPNAQTMHYVVIKKFENASTAESMIPDTNKSYKEYFEQKYILKIIQPNQPLLPVIAISNRINCIVPRLKVDKHIQKMEERVEDLLPELCVLQELPAVYWVKAMVVPSIVHRVSGLLAAYHLGRDLIWKIMEDGKSTAIAFEDAENTFMELDCPCADENVTEKKNTIVRDVEETMNTFKKLLSNVKSSEDVQSICEPVPADIVGFVGNDTLTYFDVMYAIKCGCPFEDAFSSPPATNKSKLNEFVNAPVLSVLNCYGRKNPKLIVPAQIEIYRSLLLMKCNEGLNQERLETLGDSFLKYLCSHFLYTVHGNDYTEGQLTVLKSEIVGNRNLYDCGVNAGLPAYVRGNTFNPREEWLPPSFHVPSEISVRLELTSLPLALLDLVEIPHAEQISGEISRNTTINIDKSLSNYMHANFELSTNCALVNRQVLNDKNIADTVEALIGIFLLSNGTYGAARLAKYLGILCPEKVGDVEELLYNKHTLTPYLTLKTGNEFDIRSVFPDYKRFESILRYEFKNPLWLLQALTHPSHDNRFTDSYEKLEFLGDAILDFLITGYIFEYSGDLTPGEVTDLRSALVNNVTFGSLAVYHGYHKFMKLKSHALNAVIARFVSSMHQRNYEIGEELLFLLSDGECKIAELVEVAKPLGDIFESVAAAIYLDSGNNLNAVWLVYYNLMLPVLDKFSKNVPKNPVRLFEEMRIPYDITKAYDQKWERNVAMFKFKFRGESYKCVGVSNSKQSAKRAAAKIALKVMRENRSSLNV